MKEKITTKAYMIDFSKIKEGYLWGECVSYAATKEKAKVELLKEVGPAIHAITGADISYTNIPVVRCKEQDLFEFEGELKTKQDIEYIKQKRDRIKELDILLNDNKVIYCYIKKGLFYRYNWSGYTNYIEESGVYTKAEAVAHAKSVETIELIPVDIEEHNQNLEDKILTLQKRLIKDPYAIQD